MSTMLLRVDPPTAFLSPTVVDMFTALDALTKAKPLTSLSWAMDASNPNKFELEIRAVDTATWYEEETFNPSIHPIDTDPSILLSIVPPWPLSSVSLVRMLRDTLIAMRAATGISVLDIDFLQQASPGTTIVSLEALPSSVPHGQPVTVTWIAPQALQSSAVDWIALFLSGSDNHAYLAYIYVANQTNGSHVFTAPATPGQYEFRYLLNNGYTSIAASVPFQVT